MVLRFKSILGIAIVDCGNNQDNLEKQNEKNRFHEIGKTCGVYFSIYEKRIALFFKRLPKSVYITLGIVFVLFSTTFLTPVALEGKNSKAIDVYVNTGDSLKTVAHKVVQSGVSVNETMLNVLLRVFTDPTKLHAGRYRFEEGVNVLKIVESFANGDVAQGKLRIADGMTFKDFRALINSSEDLNHTTEKLTESEILKKLGSSYTKAEGLFSPDTYHFRAGVTDMSVLTQAYEKQKAVLEREWKARAPGLKLRNPYEALILASIIEKETGIRTDRHLVSSVFHNRLRIWMPLQTDPTVIYGLGDAFKDRLRKADLQRPGPYNTYLNYGLPPTPICMPTTLSIQAALHPSSTKYLYFVARGDGTSVFSVTLDAHNKAVNRYQKTPRR